MKLLHWLSEKSWIDKATLLELYPPFLFMGVKVKIPDPKYRKLVIELPLRWFGRNFHGTMFGGFICAASDPLPLLLAIKVLPKLTAVTKTHTVEFVRPATTDLHATVQISAQDVRTISTTLKKKQSAIHTFQFEFLDSRNRTVAKIRNTVYFRRKDR